MNQAKFNQIKEIILCPSCFKKTKQVERVLICGCCKRQYILKDKKIYFLQPNTRFKTTSWFDRIKTRFKRNQKLYDILVRVISPVYVDYHSYIKRWIKKFRSDSLILNIGSGPFRIHPNTINLDVFDYSEVDVVADASQLPFEDSSIDGIINLAVLEHVKNPQKLVDEFHRVLKKEGKFFVFIPFLQGFHASPNDYYRWTTEGAKELFKKFDKKKVIVSEGPTSSLLWVFQEWFAMTFSFYSKHLYRVLLILIMVLTFPFKYLDFFLKHHPEAKKTTAGLYVIGKK